jgi:hypothetical protein
VSQREVAVVSFASVATQDVDETETQLLYPVVTEAMERSGLSREEIGFTCSGSCDYLVGAPFAFVGNLEATGAWPPISESHVEMDGAWALYEAWVRLQHGDVDAALVFSSGLASRGDLREVLCLQLDPYYLMPMWVDDVSLAGLQASAVDGEGALLPPPGLDGAAAAVLVAGDKAREVCERPAWITGIDHRTDAHYPGVRDLATSPSTRVAGEQAGAGDGPVEVAHLAANHPHEERILREALGLGDATKVVANRGPLMVTGLANIGEAFREINEGGRDRALAHATSGPCLQQNLVCVLERRA